ncbi:MAG: adenylyltransferase/cytidyltransferase family protein [bacterium]
MNFDHKIFPLSSLKDIKIQKTKKIVLVGGCFDIFHYGHAIFLQKARTAGDVLILLLESDTFIKTVKKKKPIHIQQQRAQILAALGYVDYVVLLPFLKDPDRNYEDIVKIIHPSVIAFTFPDPKELQKRKFAQTVNAEILSIPHLASFSSSQLITYASISRD